MTQQQHYPEPVAGLLTLGEPQGGRVDPRIAELGLTQEHVPDLVHMAVDPDLNNAPARAPRSGRPTTPCRRSRSSTPRPSSTT